MPGDHRRRVALAALIAGVLPKPSPSPLLDDAGAPSATVWHSLLPPALPAKAPAKADDPSDTSTGETEPEPEPEPEPEADAAADPAPVEQPEPKPEPEPVPRTSGLFVVTDIDKDDPAGPLVLGAGLLWSSVVDASTEVVVFASLPLASTEADATLPHGVVRFVPTESGGHAIVGVRIKLGTSFAHGATTYDTLLVQAAFVTAGLLGGTDPQSPTLTVFVGNGAQDYAKVDLTVDDAAGTIVDNVLRTESVKGWLNKPLIGATSASTGALFVAADVLAETGDVFRLATLPALRSLTLTSLLQSTLTNLLREMKDVQLVKYDGSAYQGLFLSAIDATPPAATDASGTTGDGRTTRYAVGDTAGGGPPATYPRDVIATAYGLDHDAIDLAPTTPPSPSATQTYTGTVGLAGGLDGNLRRETTEYLQRYLTARTGDVPAGLEQTLQMLNDPSAPAMLAQALSGLREAFRMRHQVLQLPVRDPATGDDFSNVQVRDAVLRENVAAARPDWSYNPLTAGQLRITRLRLVDTFGQVRDAVAADATSAPPVRSSSLRRGDGSDDGSIVLRPRFAQPARLMFQWLAAIDDRVEISVAPASTPICGWVLFNHLDARLMIYDDEHGRPLGSLGTIGPLWQGAPGNDATFDTGLAALCDEPTVNAHLRDVLRWLTSAADPQQCLRDLMAAIDRATTLIDPPNAPQHRSTSVMFGRPLAIVRAQLDLELRGLPAPDHSWAALSATLDGRSAAPPDAGFPDIEVPVRLGDLTNLADGLVGYFVDDDAGAGATGTAGGAPGTAGTANTFYVASTTASAPPAQHAGVAPATARPIAVTARHGSKPVTLTMLVDPRADVHATAGLLPVVSLGIPPSMYSDALRDMLVTFLAAPVLANPMAVSLPLPAEPGFTWTWITRSATGWEVVPDLVSPNPSDAFSQPSQAVMEGWIALTPEPGHD